ARVQLVLADTDEPLVKPIETTIRVPADGRLAMAGGIAIENLAEAIRGCVVGESRTFESIVPKSLRGAEHAGQPAHCTVEIQSTERITPVSIDELIKRYGSPSEVTLRQQVRLSLEHQFSIEQQQHLTDAVFDALTERITCPVPTRVVAKRVAEQQEQMIKSAVESGLEPAEAKTIADEKKKRVLASVMKEANRSVIGMLLRQKLQVGLSEQDVESRIRAMAGLRGMRPEDVRKEVLDAGQIDMVAKQAFESKIAEEILAESTVRDAPAAEVGLRGA
ncbi:MAG: hypothetical protein QF471_06385, partial [Phycisphaerales bacterium]|nr:hypothetical protein [Phycisphaerales bacterium]